MCYWCRVHMTEVSVFLFNINFKFTLHYYFRIFLPLHCRLIGGAEFLFQAKDEDELSVWVGALQFATTSEGSAGPSRSQTLPAGSEKKDEPKRRSFFTLKKK